MLLCSLLFASTLFNGNQVSRPSPMDPSTWGATDGLGRPVPLNVPIYSNKLVGMFYFLTHLGSLGNKIYDNTKILATSRVSPDFGPAFSEHWWGQPIFGYYRSDDPWVIRRQLELLEDAGVDTLIFDVTNGPTYPEASDAIFKVMETMRSQGLKTPQIMYITHAQTAAVVNTLYNYIYKDQKYKNLWFMWDGKPLILGTPSEVPAEMRGKFTIRESWAWSDPHGWFGDGKDKWGWLDHTPQNYGWHTSPHVPEEMPVSVAEHPTSNIGRDFHNGQEPSESSWHPEQGIFFQDQWNQALKVKPEFVYVTGWNEWTATSFPHQNGVTFTGHTQKPGDFFFVDEFSEEYNRDIEPEEGALADDTYYQLVSNIRKFKGSARVPIPSLPKTINNWSDWDSVRPNFYNPLSDTQARNWAGSGDNLRYENSTARNGFTFLKVARDSKSIYFLAECKTPLLKPNPNETTGRLWMNLFIAPTSTAGLKSGWEGYKFRVRTRDGNYSKGVLEETLGGWKWKVVENVRVELKGNKIVYIVPRSNSFFPKNSKLSFQFKWIDNAWPNDILHTYTQGTTAPYGRFNFVFKE